MRKLNPKFQLTILLKLIIGFIILTNSLLCWQSSNAENTNSENQPRDDINSDEINKVKVFGNKEKLKEIIKLDLEMTHTSANLLKDSAHYDDKILYLNEKLAAITCFPDPRNQESADSECEDFIKKLKLKYPNHPIVICKENGLNSKLCYSAYQEQLVVSTSDAEKLQDQMFKNENFDREQEYVDLELKLDKFYLEGDLASLRNSKNDKFTRYKYLLAIKELNKNEKDELQKLIPELKNIFKKLVPIACRESRTVYVPDIKKIENRNIFYVKPSKETEDLSTLVAKMVKGEENESKTEPKADTKPKSKIRIRVHSDQCLTELKSALEFDPKIKEIYCFHDGLTSPRCRNFVENKKVSISPQKSIKRMESEGISSF